MKNMKYLLRLLGTVTLAGLSITTLAACSTPKANKTDLSQMQASDITVTKNNIIVFNPSSVTQTEVIKAITPSILASIKKITQNKKITEADFTIALAVNAQGDAYQPLDLSPNATVKTTFVQITSVTKALSAKTKWLSYLLPKAIAAVTDLNDLGTVIPPSVWNVGNIADIKEEEIISAIRTNILTAVQAIKHNNAIVDKDIKIQVALNPAGTEKIPTDFAWGSDLKKLIYFQVSSTGNPAVIGKTNEDIWLWVLLTKPTDTKIDLNKVIGTKELGKVVAKNNFKDVKPSAASILLVINKLNNVNLTENNVNVNVNSDKEAVIEGKDKGPYSGSSVAVTFTTMPVNTKLGDIITQGKLPTDLQILNALNEKNANYTTGWENLTSSTFKVVGGTTSLSATVINVLHKDFKGVLDLIFTSTSRVDITTFKTFVPPTDIVFDPDLTNAALESDLKIQEAVVNGVNKNFSIDINRTDFTLTVEHKTNVQEFKTPIKITITAYDFSTKIIGSFAFNIYLKVDITPGVLANALKVPANVNLTNAVLLRNAVVVNNVKDVIYGLNSQIDLLNLLVDDCKLTFFKPYIISDRQSVGDTIKIIVTATSTSLQITGSFTFDVTLT